MWGEEEENPEKGTKYSSRKPKVRKGWVARMSGYVRKRLLGKGSIFPGLKS